MKLKKLLKDIPGIQIKGSKHLEISGLCNNSKLASPGTLFFAKKGLTQSGVSFIEEAALAGACAIATDLFNPFLQGVTQILYPDITALERLLSERFYDAPSQKLLAIGCTGTNGKTTCSYMLKYLLDGFAKKAGLIGTVEWIIGDTVFPSSLTTPDLLTNQKLLHDMHQVGCKSVVMEVSSHAMDQGRVACIEFDRALFTNLTQDHLDYHKTMEEYAKAKKSLFLSLKPGRKKEKVAIINLDCPWGASMAQDLPCSVLSYGLCPQADVRAEEVRLGLTGTEYFVCYQDQRVAFQTSLIGKFNVYNGLAVIATGLSLGMGLSAILQRLSSFQAVCGRLERVENKAGKSIFVDYAHTEDALKNVLQTLRALVQGKIFCVFGCGGNRDRLKRPKMGAIVEQLADRVFVTSDNPRGEDPEQIIQQILTGIKKTSEVVVEVDRARAIEKAIGQMGLCDVLLIAGKGHETTQSFSHHTIHFDDRVIAKKYC